MDTIDDNNLVLLINCTRMCCALIEYIQFLNREIVVIIEEFYLADGMVNMKMVNRLHHGVAHQISFNISLINNDLSNMDNVGCLVQC